MPETTQTIKVPAGLQVRAAVMPETFNRESRTVELQFGSDTPTPMPYYDARMMESLSFAAGHCRLDFMNRGASVLDNHGRWGSVTDGIIGVVEKAWTDGQRGYCKIRLSKSEKGNKVLTEVQDGIIRWVSVGYRVYKYELEVGQDTEIYRAVDWEPMEVSFVPVPADTSASVRSADAKPDGEHEVVVINKLNIRTMDENQNQPGNPVEQQQPVTPPTPAPVPPAVVVEPVRSELPSPAPVTTPAQPVTPPAPVPAPGEEQTRRVNDILLAVRAAGLDIEFAQNLITDTTVTPEIARQRCLAEWQTRGAGTGSPAPRVQGDRADGAAVLMRSAMETAIAVRLDPSVQHTPDSQRYRSLTLLEMAREVLAVRGVQTAGLSRREVAEIALGLRSAGGIHTISDFPIILGNTVNRTLRAAYDVAPRTFMPFCRRVNATDFREMTRAQLSQVDGFNEVLEGGEYTVGTFGEAAEKYKVAKYGRKFCLSWEMLINDDLGAFTRIANSIGVQAAQKQSDIVYAILLNNPDMYDGIPLFHADHGNLSGTNTNIDIASLQEGRTAIRVQKDLDGKTFLNLAPKFIIAGPFQELAAYQYTSSNYVPQTPGTINPAYNASLTPIIESRITGADWFLAASPGVIDTLEYAFLEGEGELFTEQRVGFDVDGLEIKARMVFAAKAIDWRGLYHNPGND